MDDTPNLQLPYIMAAQAQKHVTHNEALRALDAIVQLSARDRDLVAPPASPADGDRYLIAAAAGGAWAGHDGEIAAWQDNAWTFYPPRAGWLCWVADEERLLAFDGTAWADVAGGGGATALNPVAGGLVGINAAADATNRLLVKSDAVLFSHDDVTPGSGDMRAKLNKAAAAGTASLLFQDDWSGRAEIGLAGDDDFHFKVSADGSSWKDAIVIDRASGAVAMPFTSLGGGGTASADAGNVTLLALLLAGLAGDRIVLTDGIADSFVDQTGVDTGASAGFAYSAADRRYVSAPLTSATPIAGSTGTPIGNMAAYGGLAAAFDGATAQAFAAAAILAQGGGIGYAGKDWGAGQSRLIGKAVAYGTSDWGFTGPGIATTLSLQGSNDGTAWTTLAAATFADSVGSVRTFAAADGLATTTAYRMHRLAVDASANAAYYPKLAELVLYEALPGNGELRSVGFATSYQPATARLAMLLKPIDDVAPNSDAIGEVSRDGGTTWTAATLTRLATLADGTLLLADDAVALAAQPAGTTMRWRLRTANNKSVQLAAVSLRWQ